MGLWQFLLKRVIQSVVVLFFVSVATFLLMHAVPGDPLAAVIGERQADRPEVRKALEARYGLNEPLPVQYVYYMKQVLQGDFGTSITTRRSVGDDLQRFIPATIELTVGALIFALGLGIPLGIVSALRMNRWQDSISRFLSLIGTAMPVFWLGLLMSYVFSYKLGWLPRDNQLDVGMRPP
jgi:peptide/nickel transport system permease protein